jgi:hypothetical protein
MRAQETYYLRGMLSYLDYILFLVFLVFDVRTLPLCSYSFYVAYFYNTLTHINESKQRPKGNTISFLRVPPYRSLIN